MRDFEDEDIDVIWLRHRSFQMSFKKLALFWLLSRCLSYSQPLLTSLRIMYSYSVMSSQCKIQLQCFGIGITNKHYRPSERSHSFCFHIRNFFLMTVAIWFKIFSGTTQIISWSWSSLLLTSYRAELLLVYSWWEKMFLEHKQNLKSLSWSLSLIYVLYFSGVLSSTVKHVFWESNVIYSPWSKFALFFIL